MLTNTQTRKLMMSVGMFPFSLSLTHTHTRTHTHTHAHAHTHTQGSQQHGKRSTRCLARALTAVTPFQSPMSPAINNINRAAKKQKQRGGEGGGLERGGVRFRLLTQLDL